MGEIELIVEAIDKLRWTILAGVFWIAFIAGTLIAVGRRK